MKYLKSSWLLVVACVLFIVLDTLGAPLLFLLFGDNSIDRQAIATHPVKIISDLLLIFITWTLIAQNSKTIHGLRVLLIPIMLLLSYGLWKLWYLPTYIWGP